MKCFACLRASTGASATRLQSKETAITIEQGAAQADAVVNIRTSRYALILAFVIAGLFFVEAVVFPGTGDNQLGLAQFVRLAGAGLIVASALHTQTFGVDLTPETVNLRGLRRRSIPWQQVQAVLRYEQLGQRTVRLILENGKQLTLRAPTSVLGMGGAAYERDFQRIGQWWLAHRGESWRPVRTEALRPPPQG